MCLIVFAWQPESPTVLRLAANRDEFYARPSAALSEWPDAPGVFAGRDLQAGGTWLGVTAQGRFAALTNIRAPRQKAGPRSRGALTADYLLGQESAPAYLDRIMRDSTEYAGFNLLVGDAQQLWHFNSQEGQPRQLESGIYGLSNASLDTPWPKLLRARDTLSERIDGVDEDLLEMLSDSSQPADHLLPDTGVGLATERLLSSVFIASATYGTRASTVLNLKRMAAGASPSAASAHIAPYSTRSRYIGSRTQSGNTVQIFPGLHPYMDSSRFASEIICL